MKFLLMLRDPVDRIHSDYRVSVRFNLLISSRLYLYLLQSTLKDLATQLTTQS